MQDCIYAHICHIYEVLHISMYVTYMKSLMYVVPGDIYEGLV